MALDGKLYVVGGYDGKKCLDSVERYNPATNEWVFVAPMAVRRRGCVVVVLHERLYVMGGSAHLSLGPPSLLHPAPHRTTLARTSHHADRSPVTALCERVRCERCVARWVDTGHSLQV